MKRGLLILFLIGIVFILGCKAEVEVPVEPEPVAEVVPEPVVEEPAPLDVLSEIEGKECSTKADCGDDINVEESFCLGGNLYQKFLRAKCSFKASGEPGFECSYENATRRVDSC